MLAVQSTMSWSHVLPVYPSMHSHMNPVSSSCGEHPIITEIDKEGVCVSECVSVLTWQVAPSAQGEGPQ